MDKPLLLVGSVPLETPEEVFLEAGGQLGAHLPCIPDGETGDRANWTLVLAYRVFHGHPDIETLRRPAKRHGVEQWNAHSREDLWSFRVRDGVSAVSFGDPGWRLGYAKEAISSYFVFRTLRKDGLLPEGIRFQVCLPLTSSAINTFFDAREDREKVQPGFEEALRQEVLMMLKHIPAHDLAIQFDLAWETVDLEVLSDPERMQRRLARNVAAVPRLISSIPAEVMLGIHICYGTLGGWPMVRPRDLGVPVALGNAVLENAGRRVDYLHLPLLNRQEDSYYEPLLQLRAPDTQLYCGVVHDLEDEEGCITRLRQLRRHLKRDFGLASPCGLGRHAAAKLPDVWRDHLRALELLSKA